MRKFNGFVAGLCSSVLVLGAARAYAVGGWQVVPSPNPSSQANLNPQSTGVQGMHDLQLESGVLSSKGKNVKLGNGVRMIVKVDILG